MKRIFGVAIIIILSWWAIKPLFHSGFFPMHDDTQVARVYEMAKALKSGQFPVRWVPDLGYGFGYPIFNFYSPLPYYIGAVFILLGFDALIATKFMIIIGILLAGIFMYLLAREFWGEWGGIISGLFLIYAPYHAVQIYVRGAVGEFWALAFVPLTVWGLYKMLISQRLERGLVAGDKRSEYPAFKVVREPKWRWIVVGALGYAGIVLSHNITAMIFTIFLVLILVFTLVNGIKKYNLITNYPARIATLSVAGGQLLITIFLGLGLSCFFWLPALMEAKYVAIDSLITGTNNFRLHFLCPWQLWNSPWGFGGSNPGCVSDGMSFIIGKIHIIMVLISILAMVWLWTKDKLRTRVVLFSIPSKMEVASIACVLFFFLFSIFMTLEISKPIWERLPFLAFVQYPWRFLSFIIIFNSFTAGVIFAIIKNKYLIIGAWCLVLGALLIYNVKYFQPQTYLGVDVNYYINQETLIWKTSKISDEYLPKDYARPKTEAEIKSITQTLGNKTVEYNFKVNTSVRALANLISLFSIGLLIGGSFYVFKKEA